MSDDNVDLHHQIEPINNVQPSQTPTVTTELRTNDPTITISFKNINASIKIPVDSNRGGFPCPSFLCWKSKKEKPILHDVSGIFTSGMNAILGPTGCGKTSLIEIMTDRKDPRSYSGEVLINGQTRPHSFKHNVGYVAQEDMFNETLTPRENIFFSANLRLPKTLSTHEKEVLVSNIISELALESCAGTRMNKEFHRGVSGGEKKRTCIGMELVLSSKILFLDEPTTGLDAATALSVMNCLHKLSQKGRQCIYQGPPGNVASYLQAQGFEIPPNNNIADIALDVSIEANENDEILKNLCTAYINSPMRTNVLDMLTNQNDMISSTSVGNHQHLYEINAARSGIREIFYLSQRTLRVVRRRPTLAFAQISVSVILGLLVGTVFFDLEKTTDPGVSNRLGRCFFLIIAQIFSTMTAIEPFIKERSLFIHETEGGYYRIWAFFIAKLLCDILPLRVIPSMLFALITYFMTGFARTASQFFIFLLAIFIANMFGSAICFFAAASIGVFLNHISLGLSLIEFCPKVGFGCQQLNKIDPRV
ncbi:unnamed protein product [Rotaria magnacalcarata]|uniref:ABC transporter domain-containing protein n=2 Tax=Rotaria magnacalcarata TaxID=392030 RepID=A0A820GME0_9BILA|nr:unnamed protein product [Rotaria magnacalcarata]